MSLNIKNEYIHDLVRRAATQAGLSRTYVIERAVVELLASLKAEAATSGLDQLLDRVHAELTASGGTLNFDALYDPETGLPR